MKRKELYFFGVRVRKETRSLSFIQICLCVCFGIIFFPSCSLVSPPKIRVIPSATPQVSLTVQVTSSLQRSAFLPGMTNSDTSLFSPWDGNDPQAVQRAKRLVQQGLSLFNVQIMGWGADDPWPDPARAEPDNWSTLDRKMQIAVATQTTPVITLCEAPWWMKGKLQANGKTKLLSSTDDFGSIAYASRVLDNKMDAWLHLVRRVAERYMVPPYNVRYFQVWNELKGYYNPQSNNWDMSSSAGNPSASNAQHGYTYMYNRVYDTLRMVAQEKGLDPNGVSIGGPYVTVNTWSSSQQSYPSHLVKAYGTYDQRSLDAITYWLQHKKGGQFIAVDASNQNDDNVNISDPFTASEKFADTVQWIRALNESMYPGASTLPIWWSEWYAMPYTATSNAYDNAVKAYAIIKLIKAGGAVALSWGSDELWNPTGPNGAQALPWYASYKAFKEYFTLGTTLYTVTSTSSQIEALASAKVTMLVNKTPHPLTVEIAHRLVALNPYQVLVVQNH